MNNNKGFTLMEMLITVLLIAILAGMAMPQYFKAVEKQKGVEAVNILSAVGKSQERYFAVNETYAKDFSDLDADFIDSDSKASPTGENFNTKYFQFSLSGTDENNGKVTATRKGSESYAITRSNTTGKVCCGSDKTSDADICETLNLQVC